jgi:hypothetical protein
MRWTIAVSLTVLAACLVAPTGGAPASEDLSPLPGLEPPGPGGVDMYRSDNCDGVLAYGTCTEARIAKTVTCSTWEHDLCCLCMRFDGTEPRWSCFGRHINSCEATQICQEDPAPDAGRADLPAGLVPAMLSGGACKAEEVGRRYRCDRGDGLFCCTCSAGMAGPRWSCKDYCY